MLCHPPSINGRWLTQVHAQLGEVNSHCMIRRGQFEWGDTAELPDTRSPPIFSHQPTACHRECSTPYRRSPAPSYTEDSSRIDNGAPSQPVSPSSRRLRGCHYPTGPRFPPPPQLLRELRQLYLKTPANPSCPIDPPKSRVSSRCRPDPTVRRRKTERPDAPRALAAGRSIRCVHRYRWRGTTQNGMLTEDRS